MCPKKLFGKVKWAEKLKIDKSLTCQQQQAKVPLDHAASRLVKRNREFNTFTTSEGVFDAKKGPYTIDNLLWNWEHTCFIPLDRQAPSGVHQRG